MNDEFDPPTPPDLSAPAVDADSARRLRLLIDEVKRAPAPALDWDAMEQSLARSLDHEEETVEPPLVKSRWIYAVAAVAAAVAALGVGMRFQPQAKQEAESDVDLSQAHRQDDGSLDLSKLAQGDAIVSGAAPVAVSMPGVLQWVLAPGSRAVIETVGAPPTGPAHVIRLEQGRVDVDVVPRKPSQKAEVFAVRVDQTRVAVRGTVFSVERGAAGRVNVQVTRGTVAVGHRGGAWDEADLLVAPASAVFRSSSGRRLLETAEAEPKEVARARPQPAMPLTPEASSAPVADPAPPSLEPVPGEKEPPTVLTTPAGAQQMVTACLQRAIGEATGETRLSVATQVSVQLDAAGQVNSVRFNPPLRPDLQSRCGGSLFGRTFAPGSRVEFPISVSSR